MHSYMYMHISMSQKGFIWQPNMMWNLLALACTMSLQTITHCQNRVSHQWQPLSAPQFGLGVRVGAAIMRKASPVLSIRTRKAVLAPQTISIRIKQDTTNMRRYPTQWSCQPRKGTYSVRSYNMYNYTHIHIHAVWENMCEGKTVKRSKCLCALAKWHHNHIWDVLTMGESWGHVQVYR